MAVHILVSPNLMMVVGLFGCQSNSSRLSISGFDGSIFSKEKRGVTDIFSKVERTKLKQTHHILIIPQPNLMLAGAYDATYSGYGPR